MDRQQEKTYRSRRNLKNLQRSDSQQSSSINDYTEEEIKEKARELKKTLDKYNLKAEFVAPRLWMDPHTQDGGFMSTSKEDREYAMWRAYRSIDIANELGTDRSVACKRRHTVCRIKITSMGNQNAD